MSLRLEHCDLSIAGHQLLTQVSASVASGEVVSLVGANGAGKSSLLKILCGEFQPSKGDVFLDHRSLLEIGLDERARRIAVLPQRSGLDFPFLVHEVIEMGRYPQMTGRQVDQRIVAEVMKKFSVDVFARRRYTTLSGGERQRVQITRVLAQLWDNMQQAVFLFDEPTAPLDLAHQLEFFSLMREVARSGAGILLVIHDINLAARYSDRLIMMKDGRIIADGPPEKVITDENVQLVFNVKVNILPATGNRSVQISY